MMTASRFAVGICRRTAALSAVGSGTGSQVTGDPVVSTVAGVVTTAASRMPLDKSGRPPMFAEVGRNR